ncbi:MAG TPA: PadR family transcriptional regulator [Cytophagales bacterium]|nr:PadR family transcriptional regulator [Cytophagales bacterium]HAA19151.1 PadR family transcriptional regulator [Cytophagales bacterium]HAP59786.1 PadR family transcriptional regulator [Cytophagales bacterium]
MITKGLMAASTKPILLSILSRGKSYGYDIIQQVKQQSGGRLEWSDGMLYPVLHKLEKEKLLGSEWQVSPDGRKRKYYFITPEGQAVLEAEKDNWLQVHNTLMRLWNQPEMKWN